MTLAKAADELDMARSTALNWEKDLKERIEAQRAEVPTPKLFEMKVRCMKALDGEIEVPEFLIRNGDRAQER